MKLVTKYFFITLMIIQMLFGFCYITGFNLLGLVDWIGKEELNPIKLFLPLIIYGAIKILYWIADPLSELFNIILRWVVLIGIFYFMYWLFFI